MSEPTVDVLRLAYRHLNGGHDSLTTDEFVLAHAGMKDAIAAVAELIEAAATVEKLAIRQEGDDRMFDRLHTALARVGGAK